MKIIVFLFVCFLSLVGYGQTNEQLIKSRIENYEDRIGVEDVYNKRTLNLLFNKKLDSYVKSVEVPSIKSLSAVLDNDDNSFSFGYAFDPRNGEAADYLKYLTYAGLRMKGKKGDSFYTIFESDKAKNNVGAEIKITWFYPGTISSKKDKSHKNEIAHNRNSKIMYKAIEEFKHRKDLDSITIDNFITKEETDYILKENKYNSFSKFWVTIRAYYPLTKNEYNLIDNPTNFNKTTQKFENWDVGLSLNFFKHFSNNGSFTLSVIPRIYNNNNILIETISSKSFSSFGATTTGHPIETNTVDFFVGEFEQFLTRQLKAEFTSFFLFEGNVGLSAAIEKNYGNKYDAINWKLGVPITLKNSKGESDINFEIQWREVHTKHSIGVSVGKTFGKFVK